MMPAHAPGPVPRTAAPQPGLRTALRRAARQLRRRLVRDGRPARARAGADRIGRSRVVRPGPAGGSLLCRLAHRGRPGRSPRPAPADGRRRHGTRRRRPRLSPCPRSLDAVDRPRGHGRRLGALRLLRTDLVGRAPEPRRRRGPAHGQRSPRFGLGDDAGRRCGAWRSGGRDAGAGRGLRTRRGQLRRVGPAHHRYPPLVRRRGGRIDRRQGLGRLPRVAQGDVDAGPRLAAHLGPPAGQDDLRRGHRRDLPAGRLRQPGLRGRRRRYRHPLRRSRAGRPDRPVPRPRHGRPRRPWPHRGHRRLLRRLRVRLPAAAARADDRRAGRAGGGRLVDLDAAPAPRRARYTRPVSEQPVATPLDVAPRSATPRSPATRDLGMSAKLLFPTREISEQYYLPLIYTACRTCYSELRPEEIFARAAEGRVAPEKQQDLVRKVIESGHGSTIEHIVFTFAISGVTRTLSHQLVRHRAGLAFDQQSQRYVNYKRPAYMVPGTIQDAPQELRERYVAEMDESLAFYADMLDAGIPGEDARFVMPNAA